MNRPHLCSRRHFLHANGFGLGSLALASLLQQDGLLAAPVKPERRWPGALRSDAEAAALRAEGEGDDLALHDGRAVADGPLRSEADAHEVRRAEVPRRDQIRQPRAGLGEGASARRGSLRSTASAAWSSANCCRTSARSSMTSRSSARCTSGVNNHAQGLYAMNAGRITAGRPALGLVAHLWPRQRDARNCPPTSCSRIPAACRRSRASTSPTAGCPSLFQGTLVRPTEPRILNLDPPPALAGAPQERQLDAARRLQRRAPRRASRRTRSRRRASPATNSPRTCRPRRRRRSTFPTSPSTSRNSTASTIRRRATTPRAASSRGGSSSAACALCRCSIPGQSWDQHGSLITALPTNCVATDQPSAALVNDLKQRGLLDTHRRPLGRRNGPPAGPAKRRRPREVGPRSQHLRLLACGSPAAASSAATSTARPTNSATRPSRTIVHHYDYHATLLHSSASTTRSSPTSATASPPRLTDGQPARVVGELLA